MCEHLGMNVRPKIKRVGIVQDYWCMRRRVHFWSPEKSVLPETITSSLTGWMGLWTGHITAKVTLQPNIKTLNLGDFFCDNSGIFVLLGVDLLTKFCERERIERKGLSCINPCNIALRLQVCQLWCYHYIKLLWQRKKRYSIWSDITAHICLTIPQTYAMLRIYIMPF